MRKTFHKKEAENSIDEAKLNLLETVAEAQCTPEHLKVISGSLQY